MCLHSHWSDWIDIAMTRWNAARTKIQLKLAIQRSRMLQEKKAALAKRARLDIAELVERGKLESARIKVESLIMDDVCMPASPYPTCPPYSMCLLTLIRFI